MTDELRSPSADTKPKPSQRERNRARTRGDIVAAALELFDAKGYQSTTVEQIVRAAGCSSATFFRHFSSKEEVLFANDRAAAAEITRFVAERADREISLTALAEPIASFAKVFLMESTSEAQRMTRLVMTTRELEARSMRMRLLWEHAIAGQLNHENGDPAARTDHVLLAGMAVTCLTTALWEWQQPASEIDIHTATLHAHARAHHLISRRGI